MHELLYIDAGDKLYVTLADSKSQYGSVYSRRSALESLFLDGEKGAQTFNADYIEIPHTPTSITVVGGHNRTNMRWELQGEYVGIVQRSNACGNRVHRRTIRYKLW